MSRYKSMGLIFMTYYKTKSVKLGLAAIGGSCLFSVTWPFLLAYKLGALLDNEPRMTIDIGAACMVAAGTIVPIIPAAATISRVPTEKAYQNTYNFFKKKEREITLPSKTGLFACELFSFYIPVLPVLALVSAFTLVPLTILLVVLFESVALPTSAMMDYFSKTPMTESTSAAALKPQHF